MPRVVLIVVFLDGDIGEMDEGVVKILHVVIVLYVAEPSKSMHVL